MIRPACFALGQRQRQGASAEVEPELEPVPGRAGQGRAGQPCVGLIAAPAVASSRAKRGRQIAIAGLPGRAAPGPSRLPNIGRVASDGPIPGLVSEPCNPQRCALGWRLALARLTQGRAPPALGWLPHFKPSAALAAIAAGLAVDHPGRNGGRPAAVLSCTNDRRKGPKDGCEKTFLKNNENL